MTILLPVLGLYVGEQCEIHSDICFLSYSHSFIFNSIFYPTLFPGGFNRKRKSHLSFQSQGRHFFSLLDTRFQEHYSFLFVFFNMLQRRAVPIQTKLKTSRFQFASVASDFANVSVGAIQAVLDRVSRGGDHAQLTTMRKNRPTSYA